MKAQSRCDIAFRGILVFTLFENGHASGCPFVWANDRGLWLGVGLDNNRK